MNKDKEGKLLLTDTEAETLYLDYFNNYITVKKFAEDIDTSEEDARNIIDRGRIINTYRKK